MDLQQINTELQQISEDLRDLLPALKDAEYKYNKVYFDTIVRSGMGNAEKREAEAFQTCDAAGLLVPFEVLKVDVRTLINRKECLIEIAKNIRMMKGQEA